MRTNNTQKILDAVNELKESFGRIDERTCNIYKLTEKQEKHLTDLNGSVVEQWKQISSNKTSIKWIIRVISAAGIVGGTATGLINWLG